jgi:hypothetical protein
MSVEFSGYGDITIWIEAFDELGALITEIGLCREVMLCGFLRWHWRRGMGACTVGFKDEGIGEGVWRCGSGGLSRAD